MNLNTTISTVGKGSLHASVSSISCYSQPDDYQTLLQLSLLKEMFTEEVPGIEVLFIHKAYSSIRKVN